MSTTALQALLANRFRFPGMKESSRQALCPPVVASSCFADLLFLGRVSSTISVRDFSFSSNSG